MHHKEHNDASEENGKTNGLNDHALHRVNGFDADQYPQQRSSGQRKKVDHKTTNHFEISRLLLRWTTMVLTVCGGVAVVWWLLQATVHRRHSKHGGIEKDEGPDARGLIRRAAEGRSEAIHGADFVVHVVPFTLEKQIYVCPVVN